MSSPAQFGSGRISGYEMESDSVIGSSWSWFSVNGNKLGSTSKHHGEQPEQVNPFAIPSGYTWSSFDDKSRKMKKSKSTSHIFKGNVNFPKGLSPGAKKLIRKILDPDPRTRITKAEIKVDQWFKRRYTPVNPAEDKEDICIDDEASTIHESSLAEEDLDSCTLINAFQLIGMSLSLDLSGFFEKEDVSERRIRFASHHSPEELIERIEDIVTQIGFVVQKRSRKLKVVHFHKDHNSPLSLSVAAEMFDISPSLSVVEVRKTCGDAKVYRQLCEKLSHDLGIPRSQEHLDTEI